MSSSRGTASSDAAAAGEFTALQRGVAEALRVAHEALATAQLSLQQQAEVESKSNSEHSSANGLSDAALHEELRAFETYIVRRVREEAVRAAQAAVADAVPHPQPPAAPSPAKSVMPVNTAEETAAARRVELQLAAQRTRSAAAEHRLEQLEAKLHALMTDVVAQSQRAAAYQKQLAATVREQVTAEVRTAAVAPAHPAQPHNTSAPSPPLPGARAAVDASAVQHVTAALAAMHLRVEAQEAELAEWQQQQYRLMDAMAQQLNAVKEENAALRREVAHLRSARSEARS